MPTGNGQIEVVFRLADGTEIPCIEDLTNVLTFLEEHQEYVKVVRCKDCKHYNDIFFKDGKDLNGCDVFDWASEPTDYCSFAERREKEDGKLFTRSL